MAGCTQAVGRVVGAVMGGRFGVRGLAMSRPFPLVGSLPGRCRFVVGLPLCLESRKILVALEELLARLTLVGCVRVPFFQSRYSLWSMRVLVMILVCLPLAVSMDLLYFFLKELFRLGTIIHPRL